MPPFGRLAKSRCFPPPGQMSKSGCPPQKPPPLVNVFWMVPKYIILSIYIRCGPSEESIRIQQLNHLSRSHTLPYTWHSWLWFERYLWKKAWKSKGSVWQWRWNMSRVTERNMDCKIVIGKLYFHRSLLCGYTKACDLVFIACSTVDLFPCLQSISFSTVM